MSSKNDIYEYLYFFVVFFLIIHCAYFPPSNYQAVWKICINRNRLKLKQLPSRKNRVR